MFGKLNKIFLGLAVLNITVNTSQAQEWINKASDSASDQSDYGILTQEGTFISQNNLRVAKKTSTGEIVPLLTTSFRISVTTENTNFMTLTSAITKLIEQATTLDIEIPENLINAIDLGTSAFWGRDDLKDKFLKIIAQNFDKNLQNQLDDLLDKRQFGDNEMAGQVLLWLEFQKAKFKVSNLEKRLLYWSYLCSKLELAQGRENFSKYSKIVGEKK